MYEKTISRSILNENTLPIIQSFCDDMPGGFFIYKAFGAGELIYVNKAVLRIFGCDTEQEFRELTGNMFKGLVHPDDYPKVDRSIQEQISGSSENLDYVEYRIIRKDGTVRYVEDYGKYITTSSYGGIFCVFINDATDRLRERMEELEKINARLKNTLSREYQYQKAILHNASLFFEANLTEDTFISSSGLSSSGSISDMFRSVNIPEYTRYSDVLGYVSKNVVKSDNEEFRRFFSIERLIGCYSNDEPEQVMECEITDRSGRERIFQFVALIGRNEYTDNIIALFVAKDITDISAKKRLFQMALKEANAANIARQTFLNNISHDIRTPLNSIIGYTELIKTNPKDTEKICHYLDNIKLSSVQLLKIVTESLELTYLESGKASLNKEECDLEELLCDVKKRIAPDAAAKNITLAFDKSRVRNFAVYADYLRLEEVLWQLLDNGVKYTGEGGNVVLRVEEDENAANGFGTFTFTVEDNGCGIEEELLGTIFEPFKRVENTTASGIFGSGLGLAVVKNIVDMMNGTISVKSSVNKGSVFSVTLTLKLQGVQRNSPDIKCGSSNENFMEGIRILLVEDNPVNLEIEKAMLEYCGCIVETAVNGREAVKKIRGISSKIYDIILMDIQMPVMDGYEAARQIRKLDDPNLADIPIIAVSANAFEDDREKSLESGMNAHFPKPIDITELRKLIGKILHISK
ncbi:MAG: response regulator [Ruminococcus sp.]|nr:response regulator [Ruminococcus sp.]